MPIAAFAASVLLIVLTLIDGFETILQPRRVTHRFRYARFFYRNTWKLWRAGARCFAPGKRREAFLGIFGPLSLLGLFASWVLALVVAFGLLHWSFGTAMAAPEQKVTVWTCLYFSGTTFFTLGLGDVTPTATIGRVLAVAESGLGFAFLAVLITYLPVLYQAFSRREVTISLLDARAGSPPSAGQLLLRLGRTGNAAALDAFLEEWEHWAAELLESHLSFPVLSYFRSQHDNQSWLAALAMILDTCALLIALVKTSSTYRAQLTFAMARHAAVDLSLVLKTPPMVKEDRLPPQQLGRLRESLVKAGLELHDGAGGDARLSELRGLYEPFLIALGQRFMLALPPILSEEGVPDNWQRSAWMRPAAGIGSLPVATVDEDHFQ